NRRPEQMGSTCHCGWYSESDKYADCLATDLPGCGESPALQLDNPTLSDYVDAVLQLVDSLGLKDQRIVVAGCSWGGYMMFDLWRRHSDRVRGFIFCNT